VKHNIGKTILESAKKLDIPIIDPLIDILDAEWELIEKLKDPNAPEWNRINEWKKDHPKLTQALEKLVNAPMTSGNKQKFTKAIAGGGNTRGGGVSRPKRDGTTASKKMYTKQNSKVVPQQKPLSTKGPAIKGGKEMATQAKKDVNEGKIWDKKKKKRPQNHSEWYVGKYAPTLVNLNFGVKKTGEVWPEGTTLPSVNAPSTLRISMALTVPTDDTYSFGQAISTLYAKLRAVNSGTTVYTVQDLTAYVLNVRAIRAIVASIHRVIKVAQMIDIYDSRVPETLIRACFRSASYAAVINQLPQIRALGLQLDQQSRSMLPLNLPILDRTEWLFSNVFTDSDDVKPQFYVPAIANVRLFHTTASNTYAMVNVDISNVPNLLTVVAPLLSTYLTTYITNVIAGDMIKAYGDSVIRPLIADWLEQSPCIPVYDEDILQQFENADVLDWYTNSGLHSTFRPSFNGSTFVNEFTPTADVTTRWINGVSDKTAKPECGCHSTNGLRNGVYVNSFRNETSPGQVLSYTRLKFHVDGTAMESVGNPLVITDSALAICGSEIIENLTGVAKDNSTFYIPVFPAYGVSDVNYYNAAVLEQFDWHPMQYYLTNLYAPAAIAWDFKNFAQINYPDVDKLHQYANYAIVEPRYDFADQGRWSASKL